MKRSMKTGAAVVGGVALGTVAVATIGRVMWTRSTSQAFSRLTALAATSHGTDSTGTFSPDQLTGLPAPVARFFEFALTPGQPLIRTARVHWEGEFRLRPDAKWSPFTAEQRFSVRPPGFVWDARIRMAPLVSVRVRDQYIAGEGAMLGKVAALVPVVNQRGTSEMAESALARYLGEALWFPAALLPAAGVVWTPIDDSTARATLTDGAITVSGDFRFASRGEIVDVRMTRYRDVNGRGVLTPFEAVVTGEYRRIAGTMVPSAAEVAWVLPEGRFAYWRGRPRTVEYDPPR